MASGDTVFEYNGPTGFRLFKNVEGTNPSVDYGTEEPGYLWQGYEVELTSLDSFGESPDAIGVHVKIAVFNRTSSGSGGSAVPSPFDPAKKYHIIIKEH